MKPPAPPLPAPPLKGGQPPVTPTAAPSPPTGPAPAAPQIGEAASDGVVSGTVSVTPPGSTTAVPLTATENLPLNTVIDARHGVVTITNAVDSTVGRQSATVWGARFTMTQKRNGMTILRPVGAPSCPPAGEVAAHTARVPPVSLWAHDHHGRYSTRGRNSVATVRGTIWETVESCAGTRTVVRRGLVSVRDLHRHVTVLVHAGHSYLARS